jgi:hypothetical protein
MPYISEAMTLFERIKERKKKGREGKGKML